MSDTPAHQIITSTTNKELVLATEKELLRFTSYLLLVFGLVGIYNELIDIFFVFPHLPTIFKALDFSETAFRSVYTTTVITATTAFVKTIYALVLIKHHHHLAHRVHLIGVTGLVLVTWLINSAVDKIDIKDFDGLPTPPTIINLITKPTESLETIFNTGNSKN